MFGSIVSESPTIRDQSVDKSHNNTRDENRATNRSKTSTPITTNVEWEDICRAYGLWRKDFDPDTRIKNQIEWMKLNKIELHKSLMSNLLGRSPISDEEVNNNKILFQELKIDYSIRRFEIEQATICVNKCDICSKTEVRPGIFLEPNPIRSSITSQNASKHIYKETLRDINSERVISFKYVYIYPKNAISRNNDCVSVFDYELVEKICKLCSNQLSTTKTKHLQPKFSPSSGFEYGPNVPDCLKNLSFAEQSAISVIQVILHLGRLNSGCTKSEGSIYFIDRSDGVLEIAKKLPWKINSINWIYICRQIPNSQDGSIKIRELRCSRVRMRNALDYLLKNTAGYELILSQTDNIWNEYPEDGYISPNYLVDNNNEIGNDIPDLGPAPDQHQDINFDEIISNNNNNNINDRDDVINPDCEGIIEEGTNPSGLAKRVRSEMDDIVRINSTSNNNNISIPSVSENNSNKFIQGVAESNQFKKWNEIPFFFTLAFPTLFMCTKIELSNGVMVRDSPSDYKRRNPRSQNFSFSEWATQLMTSCNGRFSKHPILKFVLLSIKNREQGISSTTFAVKQSHDSESAMDKNQIAELFANNPISAQNMSSKISAFTQSIVGSPAYWWQQKRNVQAMIEHKLLMYNQLPIAFTTGSMAEYHWRELHRVLYDYFIICDLSDEALVCEPLSIGLPVDGKNHNKLRNILIDYTCIVNQFFVIRTNGWFEIVLRQGLGIDDYWYRFEFAKSRGAIHFHGLLFSKMKSDYIHKKLDRIMNLNNLKLIKEVEKEISIDITESSKFELVNITALHPSGRQRSNPEKECNTIWYTSRLKVANGLE